MSRIRIQLFGQFCVRRNEQLLSGFESNKVQELFCYLLLHQQHSLSREFLASLLWPDTTTDQSRKKLRQTLWHLRSALGSQNEPVHDRLLLVEPNRIKMNTEANLWLDVAVIERAFNFVQGVPGQELDAQKVQLLQNALHYWQTAIQPGAFTSASAFETYTWLC
jgi:DNA-binding SARP family transcriptional activator